MMKAHIAPLSGKYYGTKIIIKDGDIYTEISIWNSGDFTPSERELAEWPEGDFEVCDSHFESKWTYDFAKKLVDAINTFKPSV
jgi:hypothetical protein